MSSYLQQRDLRALAQKSEFKARKLAATCGVSLRTLERYLRLTLGLSPRQFLKQIQRAEAARLKQEGYYAKEIALRLGYTHTSSYCRGTRLEHRLSPSNGLSQIANTPHLRITGAQGLLNARQ